MALAEGKTVTVATAMRSTRIKAKHVAAWGDVPYFTTDSTGATRMITRTRKGQPVYDIIDGCRVTAA